MSDDKFPKFYQVQNDTIAVDESLHRSLNVLAGRFYLLMGYSRVDPNFDYAASNHPQEQMMYMMALEAAYMQQSTGELDG